MLLLIYITMRPILQYIFINKRQLFIKNTNLNTCINCIHFIEHKTNYPYDDLSNDKKYGKCKIFGEKNLVTGEIEYNYAFESRKHQTLCGINGKYFVVKLK